jgi:hypothetical protein
MASHGERPDRSAESLWLAENLIARLVAGIHRCGGAVAKMAETVAQRHALERELTALDDSQLGDLGITREQIPVLVSAYPESAELLTRMLARLGITEAEIVRNPGLRHELEHSCAHCFVRRECRRYLKLPTDQNIEGYRNFCPNAAELDELRSPRSDAQPA